MEQRVPGAASIVLKDRDGTASWAFSKRSGSSERPGGYPAHRTAVLPGHAMVAEREVYGCQKTPNQTVGDRLLRSIGAGLISIASGG